MFEMWFESIYLYFLEINPHYTQLFSSRETPPASTDVSRFLLQKYSRQLEMNALFRGEKNKIKVNLMNNSQEKYTSSSIEKM